MKTSRRINDGLALGLLLAAALLASIAAADVEEKKRIALIMDRENGEAPFELRLDTAEPGYAVFELVEGEISLQPAAVGPGPAPLNSTPGRGCD